MKYVYSILVIIIGAFMVIKTEWMLKFFGRSYWAETKLGTEGGSRLLYKLIGIIFIFVAFMIMTGWAEDILWSIFKPTSNLM